MIYGAPQTIKHLEYFIMKRFYQSVSAGALLLCGSISFTTSIDVITDQRAKFWENSVSSLFYFMSKADMDGA